jgi:ABC-type cobalamin/Fe3+-siderophores transport system ATPase subunit
VGVRFTSKSKRMWKSTLLKMIGGLLDETSGHIMINEENITAQVIISVSCFKKQVFLSILINIAMDVFARLFLYPIAIDHDNLSSQYVGVYNSFIKKIVVIIRKFKEEV